MKDEREKIEHSAFGQIVFSRVSGNGTAFYGSQVAQSHFIMMDVRESTLERTLSRDWYFGGKILLRLRMTSNQFAEMITSLNQGDGVPCTLEHVHEKKIEPFNGEQETKNRATHRQFKERLQEFATTLKEKQAWAKELVKKKSLSKDDQFQLNLHLEWMTGEIERNMPYFMECFQETMDAVVLEAKTEAENAIQHKLTSLGLGEVKKLMLGE
jgi:hypothetical protein